MKPLHKITLYYALAKPGIIYGNALSAIAGFFLASKSHIHPAVFLAMLFGLSAVIAASCIINNYLDRDIDLQMERTKNRALALRIIPSVHAFLFAGALYVIGFSLLIFYTTITAALAALTGVIFYVILYSICKRRSVFGTLVGSVAGAVPPVVGYTAVSGRFDMGALLLFLILVFWQMPHFYAIAIRRLHDYTRAGLPVWPVKNGVQATKIQITIFIVGFIGATLSLTLAGYTGLTYFFILLAAGVVWLYKAIEGFRTPSNTSWAKSVFFTSLVVLLIFCVTVSLNVLLP